MFVTAQVENIVGKDNVLVIEILDGNSTPKSLENMEIFLKSDENIILAGISGKKAFFSGITNGNYTIGFSSLASSDANYTIVMELCENTEETMHCMDAKVDEEQKNVNITQYITQKLTVFSEKLTVFSEKRVVTASEGIDLTVTYSSSAELTYTVYKIDGTEAVLHTLQDMQTKQFLNGQKTHINLDDASNGTYLIVFEYGGTAYRYAFIVTGGSQ